MSLADLRAKKKMATGPGGWERDGDELRRVITPIAGTQKRRSGPWIGKSR